MAALSQEREYFSERVFIGNGGPLNMVTRMFAPKFKLLFLIFLISSSSQANAQVPKEVRDLFNSNNRILSSPPKTIRSDRKTPTQSLFASGKKVFANLQKRFQTKKTAPIIPDQIRNQNSSSNFQGSRVVEVLTKRKTKAQKTQSPEKTFNQSEFHHDLRTNYRSNGMNKVSFNGKRFVGLGLIAAGSYGIFGAELDIKLKEKSSIGIGYGTGMSFNSFGAYVRQYFGGNYTVSPFFQLGYSHWHMKRSPRNSKEITPSFLTKRFLAEKNGKYTDNKRAHLLYPAIGVLFQTKSGLALSLNGQYFVSLSDFSGALFGSMGFHYYF